MSQKVIARFRSMIDGNVDRIEKFKDSLSADPAYALSWSNDTFRAAALLTVLRQVVHNLENGASVDDIKNILSNRVMCLSRYPAQSTSPTSNLMAQYELSSCVELLDSIEFA